MIIIDDNMKRSITIFTKDGKRHVFHEAEEPVYPDGYFKITSLGSGNIKYSAPASIQYSLNRKDWSEAATSFTVPVEEGTSVWFKGENTNKSMANAFKTSDVDYNVGGRLMSLVDGLNVSEGTDSTNYNFQNMFDSDTHVTDASELELPNELKAAAFRYMFENATNLEVAPSLPYTGTIPESAYNSMFEGCTSLTVAPLLPSDHVGIRGYAYMFDGCTSLTEFNELPAATLSSQSYMCMFRACTSLVTAPNIHVNTMENDSISTFEAMFKGCTSLTTAPERIEAVCHSACKYMFEGCTSLTVAPELPATTLADNCYEKMFKGCSSLTEAPVLPAMTVPNVAYDGMFQECSSLTEAPELPATSVGNYGYSYMFYLTGIVDAPALPATTVGYNCYEFMFSDCSDLETTPELNLATVPVSGYRGMFYNCPLVNSVTIHATDVSASNALLNWLENVAETGTVYNLGEANLPSDSDSGVPEGWTEVTDVHNYLKLTALTSGFIAYISSDSNVNVQYSTDACETWTDGGHIFTVNVNAGDKVYLKGQNEGRTIADGSRSPFRNSTVNYSVAGRLYSIMDGLEADANNNPKKVSDIFREDSHIIDASKLQLMNDLAQDAANAMFYRSSNLVHAPKKLPATTLAKNCYKNMFNGCSSLVDAPVLPATTLVDNCYDNMFNGCSSLTSAPELPATVSARNCYFGMFSNTGLTTTPAINFTEFEYQKNNVCDSMFEGCTNLTSINPDTFQVTAYDLNCSGVYQNMFKGCTGLTMNALPELPLSTTDRYGQNGMASMFENCTGLVGTLHITHPNLSQSMYKGCTGITGVEFDVTPHGYAKSDYAFENCTGITSISNVTNLGNNGNGYVFKGCTGLVDLSDVTLTNCNLHGMFMNCTNLVSAPTIVKTSTRGDTREYTEAFRNCASLVNAPTLPVIESVGGGTNNGGICEYTYAGCTSLTSVPNIPLGVNPVSGSYTCALCYHMFDGCTSLTTAPTIPNFVIYYSPASKGTLEGMFQGCTSLTTPPTLPTADLNTYCFKDMFKNSGITTAPALPKTTLAASCYEGMFSGCDDLTTAPDLPAVTLTESCYKEMFKDASSLNSVKIYAEDVSASNCLNNWLSGVAATGTVFNEGMADLPTDSASGVPTGWTNKTPMDYFNITLAEDGTYTFNPSDNTVTIEASTDKTNWTTVVNGTATSATKNVPVYFRGSNSGKNMSGTSNTPLFSVSKSFDVAGRLMSLVDNLPELDFEDEATSPKFQSAFQYSNVVNANKLILPYKLSDSCFLRMFSSSGLVTAPKLRSTTLANSCYMYMFSGCYALTNAPALPATTLTNTCYFGMFMSTPLVDAPELPATTLADGCYNTMFRHCERLTIAPELPATTLINTCYKSMFMECSSLNKVILYAENISSNTLTDWLKDVASTGTVFNFGGANLPADSTSGIPTGWTENKGGELFTEKSDEPLTMTVLSDGNIWFNNMPSNISLKASVNSATAEHIDQNEVLSVHAGDVVKWYADGDNRGKNLSTDENSQKFFSTANIKLSGRLMSLVYDDANFYTDDDAECKSQMSGLFSKGFKCTDASELTLPEYTNADHCLARLFADNATLIFPPTIHATNARGGSYAYTSMFVNCTSLIVPPYMATTQISIQDGCFARLLRGCTKIKEAPTLRFTQFNWYCCPEMFKGCSNLKKIVSYVESEIRGYATPYWVEGVAATGDFYNLGGYPYTTGNDGIPSNWTVHTSN